MAYNNGFPMGYQQFYPQYQTPQQSQMQAQNTGIIWVQGEAGAKSYLVAPNCTVALWDSEEQTIYLKSADASGMPSMRILDYSIRDVLKPQKGVQNDERYVTKEELRELEKRLDERFKGLKEGVTNEPAV